MADHRDKIDPERFPPFWRESLDDLLDAYGRICAYACVYIERVTGAPSVDHMMPKSKRWQDVYEWTNYRLACSLMNARKNDVPYVLDPFEVEDDWFEMELVAFQLVPKPDLDEPTRARIDDTIRRLGLNEGECPIVREEYAVNYWEKHIDLEYLERRAPFVARELRRQGKLREGDS